MPACSCYLGVYLVMSPSPATDASVVTVQSDDNFGFFAATVCSYSVATSC